MSQCGVYGESTEVCPNVNNHSSRMRRDRERSTAIPVRCPATGCACVATIAIGGGTTSVASAGEMIITLSEVILGRSPAECWFWSSSRVLTPTRRFTSFKGCRRLEDTASSRWATGCARSARRRTSTARRAPSNATACSRSGASWWGSMAR